MSVGNVTNRKNIVPFAKPIWKQILIGTLLVISAIGISATQGSVDIPLSTTTKISLNHLPFVEISKDWPNSWDTIIWEVRLPRVIAAGLVGASLALAGGAYQGIFRNPLADPYLIGVASGAGLAATIIIISPIPTTIAGINLLPPIAFLGAICAVTISYGLSRIGGGISVTTLILSGVAITFLASSTTTFLMLQSSPDVRPVLSWLLGGIASAGWQKGLWLIPYILPCSIIIIAYARKLNVLMLDDNQAWQLGIDVKRVRLVLIITASLITAAAVSVSGMIGFIGLMAPHAARLIWGADNRSLLPMSFLLGGFLLIIADMFARTMLNPQEIPVGVVTAFLGAPFFLYILMRSKISITHY